MTTVTTRTERVSIVMRSGAHVTFRASSKVKTAVGSILGWLDEPPAGSLQTFTSDCPTLILSGYNATTKKGRSFRVRVDPDKIDEVLSADGTSGILGKDIDSYKITAVRTPRRRVYV